MRRLAPVPSIPQRSPKVLYLTRHVPDALRRAVGNAHAQGHEPRRLSPLGAAAPGDGPPGGTGKDRLGCLQNYAASAWLGFVVPAGVSPHLVDAMVEGVRQVYGEDRFADRIIALGTKPVLRAGAVFRELLVAEAARWREVAERAGIGSIQQ